MSQNLFTLLLLLVHLLFFTQSHSSQHEKTECVYGRIRLECPPLHTIKITSVQLADSRCYRSNCCPAVDDCAKQPSDQHRSMVFSLCNGHPSCDFDVAIEKIGCNWFSNNDYERVQWKCIQTATTVIATTTTTTVATTTPTSSILKKYSVTNHSNSNVSFYTKEREFAGESENRMDQISVPEMRKSIMPEERRLNGIEPLVVFVVAGLVLIALIISITCIITRRYKLREQKYMLATANGLYLRPISFQQLNAAATHGDTYDFIKESTEDGYLKPIEAAFEKQKKTTKNHVQVTTTGDDGCCSSDSLFRNGCKNSCNDHQYQRISNIYSNPKEMVSKAGEEEERYVLE